MRALSNIRLVVQFGRHRGAAAIGTIDPTTTRIDIAGTALERGKATPLVLPIGAAANDSRSMVLAQRVELARKCDGPAK